MEGTSGRLRWCRRRSPCTCYHLVSTGHRAGLVAHLYKSHLITKVCNHISLRPWVDSNGAMEPATELQMAISTAAWFGNSHHSQKAPTPIKYCRLKIISDGLAMFGHSTTILCCLFPASNKWTANKNKHWNKTFKNTTNRNKQLQIYLREIATLLFACDTWGSLRPKLHLHSPALTSWNWCQWCT